MTNEALAQVAAMLETMTEEERAEFRKLLIGEEAPKAAEPPAPTVVGTPRKVTLDDVLAMAPAKRMPKTARAGVFYTRVRENMLEGGNVPNQQMVIANLLVAALPLNERICEAEMMNLIGELNGTPSFPTAAGKQNAWDVFKYYVNLKGVRGKYFGFIQRRFLVVEGANYR